jgi:hypothetical protein
MLKASLSEAACRERANRAIGPLRWGRLGLRDLFVPSLGLAVAAMGADSAGTGRDPGVRWTLSDAHETLALDEQYATQASVQEPRPILPFEVGRKAALRPPFFSRFEDWFFERRLRSQSTRRASFTIPPHMSLQRT